MQAQTRILLRSLLKLGIPALLLVNKIDRPGARPASVLNEITGRLRTNPVAMTAVTDAGSPDARVTARGAAPG